MKNELRRSVVAAEMTAEINDIAETTYHATSPSKSYKCIFNHELLIISHKKDNTAEYIKSFISKMKDTDVDAVMCCPEMWRTNVFPSEVDPTWKRFKPGQPASKFPSWDYMMTYLHEGGDPVKDTLESCRETGIDFFISYRMNDPHFVQDPEWPCHNDFWRDNPECWLTDADSSPFNNGGDDSRLHNYMLPEVRDYYFAIIQELCTNYDVDGFEFDFQRWPQFFKNDELAEGTKVMAAFVKRVRDMLSRIGAERGKTLKLCVRVPHTVELCEKAGLDVIGWDAAGLIDMINVSSSYYHTMEMDVEDFQKRTEHANIYGEMNYITCDNDEVGIAARRYTTLEIYRASALNLFARGVDGLSIFNYDYVPESKRLAMVPGLNRITDLEYLRSAPKDYAVYPHFGLFETADDETLELIIPDDTSKVSFDRSVLRVETQKSCEDIEIRVWLNGEQMEECDHAGAELFPPVVKNDGYATRDAVKFYTVPLNAIIAGKNTIKLQNLDKEKCSCTFFSVEIALYH